MPNPGLEKSSGVGGEKTVFGYQLFLHYTLPTGARLPLADNLWTVKRLRQRRKKASVSMTLGVALTSMAPASLPRGSDG
jgi:hypothetical protein